MLNVARPETRVRAHPDQRRLNWGIVDFILGVIMLPFGIWMFVIEGGVNFATWLFTVGSEPRRRPS